MRVLFVSGWLAPGWLVGWWPRRGQPEPGQDVGTAVDTAFLLHSRPSRDKTERTHARTYKVLQLHAWLPVWTSVGISRLVVVDGLPWRDQHWLDPITVITTPFVWSVMPAASLCIMIYMVSYALDEGRDMHTCCVPLYVCRPRPLPSGSIYTKAS